MPPLVAEASALFLGSTASVFEAFFAADGVDAWVERLGFLEVVLLCCVEAGDEDKADGSLSVPPPLLCLSVVVAWVVLVE